MAIKKTLKDMAAEARQDIPEVDADGCRTLLEHDAILLDVRDPEEHATSAIPGAVNISRGTLEHRIENVLFHGAATETDLSRTIVCYCGGGSRSLLAAKSIREMGFTDVRSLAGGYRGWVQAGRPVQ